MSLNFHSFSEIIYFQLKIYKFSLLRKDPPLLRAVAGLFFLKAETGNFFDRPQPTSSPLLNKQQGKSFIFTFTHHLYMLCTVHNTVHSECAEICIKRPVVVFREVFSDH
jgi:hypothetical protein